MTYCRRTERQHLQTVVDAQRKTHAQVCNKSDACGARQMWSHDTPAQSHHAAESSIVARFKHAGVNLEQQPEQHTRKKRAKNVNRHRQPLNVRASLPARRQITGTWAIDTRVADCSVNWYSVHRWMQATPFLTDVTQYNTHPTTPLASCNKPSKTLLRCCVIPTSGWTPV
ncbi:hypothetical protein RSOLAG1IB_10605 [Rhizoctonia solani AG-1 IB]|uniref:Uncharacterized protein n=1 Tax=Thanatephorus cucumeris (strain AG1-IB / isolate 7/3/14) TaxID=1108050 RepID=A0A0B7FZ07_THACB|nr:hypothetical protein RSOLAG1IB_10605 [Rhizoctonia solani AG-1 IB]